MAGTRALLAAAVLLMLAACGAAPAPPPPPLPPGAPAPVGLACDGFAGVACPAGQYCRHEPGVCLSTADAQGRCEPRPEGCIALSQPVCGCDGRTYGNSCEAAGAGTSVGHEGPCRSEPQ
jgi:hypothetical protein